jgi:hypothetical protein
VGWLLGWRYAVWRVEECAVRAEVDWSAEDRAAIARLASYGTRARPPYALVLMHVRGPKLDEVRPDGRLHLIVRAGAHVTWNRVPERFAVCSCHGDPFPCLADVRDRIAEEAGKQLDRKLAGTAPGVCYACRGPITARQKTVTFPEPNLEVPGAPGPTFHLRRECRYEAQRYERLRLRDYPHVDRLVTCTGAAFTHQEGKRRDCTAGPLCTGHHWPGEGDWCGTSVWDDPKHQLRPFTRCSFEGCTGLGETEASFKEAC